MQTSDNRFPGRVGIWSYDPISGDRWVSSDVWRIVGVDSAAAQHGRALWDQVHPADRDRVLRQRELALTSNLPFDQNFRIITPRGEVRSVYATKRAVNLDGRQEFVGVVVDLTTWLAAMEEAVRRDRERYANGMHEPNMALETVVHELRQPLASILLTAQAGVKVLDGQAPQVDAQQMRELLTEIIDVDHHAGTVMERIRALADDEPLRVDAIQPAELIRDVLALTHQRTSASNVVVESELDADVPSISGDTLQLQQVLINLVMNACDAMESTPPDARRLRLGVSARGRDWACFAVTDSGAGIVVQPLARIFKPFVTSKSAGTGLGLAICRRVIERHGGRIWAHNNADRGSTFTFVLPSRVKSERASEPAANEQVAYSRVARRRAAATIAASRRVIDAVRATCDRVRNGPA